MKSKTEYRSAISANTRDCGRIGRAIESALTGKPCKSAGKIDWYHLGVRYEIKHGGGELGEAGKRLLKGVQRVLYIPVPVTYCDANGVEWIDLHQQEGFLLSRDAFLLSLEQADLLREKKPTAGSLKVTIQTFWNAKQNKPHGRKVYALLDALYENCDQTLEEFIAEEEARG